VAHRTALRAGGDAQKPSQGDDASGNLEKGKHPSQGWDLQWVEGRCLSYGGSIAYSLWLDMLHSVLDVPHNAAATIVRDALRAQVQALCTDCFDEVYPSLCRLLSLPLEERYASLRDLQGESLRAEVFAAVQTLIERTASRRPLAMICEDLHWADPTSLALLERILALTDRAALLLICALRPEVEHGCWQVREAAARYYRHRQTDLWLDALTAGETQALVGHLLHVEDLPWALQSKILDHAEGNPFYAEEILRELIDNGAIVYDDATGRCQVARGIETIPIPDTLQGVLSARIDRLEPETRRVLRLASVIGRVFPYRILAEIAGDGSPLPAGEGTGVRALDVHLLALQRQQLIRERARLPEVEYIFQHELTREAAYSGLLKAERLACHRRAAEALERLYPDQLEEQAALLAQHWEGAEESERAIECRLEAGEPARVAYANEEAIAHFRRALSLLDGHELNEAHPEWRLDALRGLGIALFGTGRADEAEAPLREAIAIGVRIGLEAHALVRLYYWLGEVRYWQGHGSDMADIGKEGLSLLDADEESVERALMMHHLATGLLNQLWSVEQYGEWGLRLARFVSRLPYEEELRPVYNHIVFSHRRLKETGAMVRWIAELEERATAHRDLRGVAEAALLRSIVCLDAGDLRGATARLSQAADMWGRLGDTKHQVRELAGIGTLYLDLGELDRAEEVITRAAAVAGSVPDGLAPSPMHEGKIAFCRGEWQAAVDAFDKAVETARGLSLPMEEGYASLWLGMVALAQADRRRAVACLQKGIALETLPDSIHFSRLLSRRLGALEAAWQDRAAFRAFCHRYQEEHPEIRERSPARCWLEPAHAGDLSGLGDLTGLDSLNWTWHDPFGDCACAPDGGLTIRAANGRDMWHVNWSAPRLMRAVPDDLAMQTIVGPAMDDRPAMGGLLLWMDERSYLGLQWGTFGPGQVGLEGAIENVDVVIGRGLLPDGAQERAFLRLERRGDHVAAFCSADGEAWFRVGRARFPAGPAQVGLYAIGSIDRAIYPGAYPDGTAIRFESFQLWEGGDGWHPAWRST
jgi:tetratricopeptide (TPR) repeat protein